MKLVFQKMVFVVSLVRIEGKLSRPDYPGLHQTTILLMTHKKTKLHV